MPTDEDIDFYANAVLGFAVLAFFVTCFVLGLVR